MDEALELCRNRLEEIRALPDNWNEDGASAFSGGLIDAARELVAALPLPPDIFPTARDSIQFQYENETGDYLEFELFEGGRLDMFSCTSEDVTETRDDIPWREAGEIVGKFCAGWIWKISE